MARKNVAFKVRIEEELRRAFIEACRSEDRPAAWIIRDFMRDYVERHRRAMQQDLFGEEEFAKNTSEVGR